MTNMACSISFQLLITGIPLLLVVSQRTQAAAATRDWPAQWENTPSRSENCRCYGPVRDHRGRFLIFR
jgi:hypothetical protein